MMYLLVKCWLKPLNVQSVFYFEGISGGLGSVSEETMVPSPPL